jgi:hypothetical protein
VVSARIQRNFAWLRHSLSILILVTCVLYSLPAKAQTTTSLTISSNLITVGSSETLTASVYAGTIPVPAGNVEFQDSLASQGGTVLGTSALNRRGAATLTVTNLSVGLHQIYAIYEGYGIYTPTSGLAPSVSPYQLVTVSDTSLLPTTTAISWSGVAGNYSLTGTVTSLTSVLPTGSMSFLDVSNGNASLASQTLDPGTVSYGFAPFSTPSAGSGPTAVAVGDFNSDGHLDLAVADSTAGVVSILLGDGSGNFTPAATPTVAVGHNPYAIAVGDFNGDGNLDLGVANFSDGTVSILLGDGRGNFTAAALSPIPVGNGPYSIATDDFNGDRHLDLAVVNSADNTVSILLGDGTGNFTSSASSPVSVGTKPYSVAVGDFQGNGILDLAVANRCGQDPTCTSAGSVSLLMGDGVGGFTPFASSPLTVGYSPTAVAVGDFNGDGIPDLAVVNQCGSDPTCASPGTVMMMKGDGAGNFNAFANSPVTVGGAPDAVSVGDFNGDGNLDLAVANFSDSTLSILKGDGAGNFSPATTAPVSVGVNPRSIAVGDFNGDGNPDLVTANFGDRTASVLHALWNESATAPVIFTTSASHTVVAVYGGDTNYAPSQSTAINLLGVFQTVLVWTPPYAIIQNTSLSGLLNATTSYNGAPVASTCAYAATPSGGSAFAINGSTLLGVGLYTLGVTCTGLYPTATGTYPLGVYASGDVLTVSANNAQAGSVTPAGTGIYVPTLQVPITATPNFGYAFLRWEANPDINNIGSPNTYVTMNGNETVTADFALIPSFVVNTPLDDASTPVASNCPANPTGSGGGTCTLRDALLASTTAGGNISFDATVFAPGNTIAANTITLGVDGPLTIPTNTTITGATSGSGATLTNLVAVSGAGANTVFSLSSGTASIGNLTIENGSTSGNGGGIANGGTLTVSNSTFTGNTASHGGGIVNSGSLTLSGSTFHGNSATYGGAISILNGSVTVSNSTFYNNLGSSGAGAIDDTQSGSFTVTGSTIYGNNSIDSTGGIAVGNSSFWMSDTIATGNGGGDCTITRSTCPATGTGGNVVGVSANLAPLGNYGGPTQTMIPLPGSVAICAIVPSGSGTDQRGMAWPVIYSGTSCQDSGAVQTDYSLSFVQQPTTTMISANIAPPPVVELMESGSPFAPAVTIPLVLKDSNGDNITALDLSGGSATSSNGIATYSSLSVSTAGTGDTLTASVTLDPANSQAPVLSQTSNSFNVTLQPTTTVASNASATYSTNVQSVALSATVSSGLGTVNTGTVTFTVFHGSTQVGVSTTSGTVTNGSASAAYSLPAGTLVGGYSIQAVYNANSPFTASSDSTHTLAVGKAAATVTLGSLSQTYTGSPVAATASTTPSSLTVTFTYNGSSTAPTTAGSYTVVGTISDLNYQGSSTGTLVIGKATATVTLGSLSRTYTGSPLAATASTTPSGLTVTITYNGSSTTPTAAGSYTVVGTISDPNYQGSSTGTLVIGKATATVTLGSLSQTYTGSPLAATASTTPSGLTVTITYNGSSTAPTAAGSYTVVGTISDPNYQGSSTGTMVIGRAALTVTANSATSVYGVAFPVFTGTLSGVMAGDGITATYSTAATPTSPAGGIYSITATLLDPNSKLGNYSVTNTPATLTITKATPAISWATPAAIVYGTALNATQLDANSTVAGTFAYTPGAGAVLPVGLQTLSVTLTPTDSTDYTTATTTVQLTVNKATPAIVWATPAAIIYGTALSATQLNASSTVAGTLVYTPAAGVVPTAGPQTLSVTFSPNDTSDYTTATATVQLMVNKATPAIVWATPAAIVYGTALSATQLNASSAVAGTLVYTPAAGVVPTVGSQTLSVTLTPTDSTDYMTATATVQLTVNKATPAIVWASPAAIAYGTALSATQLDASSTVSGSFVYTPAAGAVPVAGTQTLSVTLNPADSTDYNPATANVQLTVNKATPTITWATPAAIAYGTALSATQLDASSTVAGSFVYTPSAGTVLPVGAQTLSVTLTPTDANDYTTATTTDTLTVNTVAQTINFTAPSSITYGAAPIALSATGGASGNPIIFSIISGPGSITGNMLTLNGAGLVVVAANQAGNAIYSAAAQVTQSITVNPASSAIAVASSASSVLAQNAITLTATVSASAGVPTGLVEFLDGTTPLGSGTLSGGVATLTTSSLSVGTHTISAVYNGATNFAAATSSALTQCVMDISLSNMSSGGPSQTITPGGSSTYTLAIEPDGGTSFPVAVRLTLSGLPTTATASIAPAMWTLTSNSPWTWTLPANTPLSGNSQLTIQMTAQAQAQVKGAASGTPASRQETLWLALLLLPFAGRMRRAGKRLGRTVLLLLLSASMAAMAGLSGCGSPDVNFTQQAESYPLTVTVSAGALSHSIPITLLVE